MQINVQKEPLIAIVMGLKYEGFNWLKLDEVSSAWGQPPAAHLRKRNYPQEKKEDFHKNCVC